MKPSFTILLLTLFATLAVAAPLGSEFSEKIVEDASEPLSNRLSNLALNHPPPSSSQARRLTYPPPSFTRGGRPTLAIPIRPQGVFVNEPIREPSIRRIGGPIRSSKKGATRDQAEPYQSRSKFMQLVHRVMDKQKIAKESAIQNQGQPMLERQPFLSQAQWKKLLEDRQLGGSGSGRRASSSPAAAGSSMDYSTFNEQDDTASSRFRH